MNILFIFIFICLITFEPLEMKRLVSMIQSRLFLLRDNDFIHGAFSDLKTLQDVFIHLELLLTAWKIIFFGKFILIVLF